MYVQDVEDGNYTTTVTDGLAVMVPIKGERYVDWEIPRGGFFINTAGYVEECDLNAALKATFNWYPTEDLAQKSAKRERIARAYATAALMVDPDYKPNWNNIDELKWAVYYDHNTGRFDSSIWERNKAALGYVSTADKCQEMVRILEGFNLYEHDL